MSKIISSIEAKLRAVPQFKRFHKQKMTDEEKQSKEKELEQLKYIGDCLMSDGWNKGIKPLILETMQGLEDISDSESSTPEIAETNKQRRIGLKRFLRAIKEKVLRAEELAKELKET